MSAKPETLVTVPQLDSLITRQIKKAERRSRKNVPDPELFAMLAVGQIARLDPGALKHLGRRIALHRELISDSSVIYSSETLESIEEIAGRAMNDLKRYRKDLSHLPQSWQPALRGVLEQYGDPNG